jgi:hypoxanthine-guanine phosphoribosyltransferase
VNPHRFPWFDFEDVVIANANEESVLNHTDYAAAKSGDDVAAERLVRDVVDEDYLVRFAKVLLRTSTVVLAAVHAEESTGRNQIAQAFAETLARHFDLAVDEQSLVQINVVNHTRANGYTRLARQALFGGHVEQGVDYVMVDDFVGQGGTLANFRGYLLANGARVVGATVLTGKPFSAKIALSSETRQNVLDEYGSEFETWWIEQFGFDFSCLTESEGRYLVRSLSYAADVDAIRNQILAGR